VADAAVAVTPVPIATLSTPPEQAAPLPTAMPLSEAAATEDDVPTAIPLTARATTLDADPIAMLVVACAEAVEPSAVAVVPLKVVAPGPIVVDPAPEFAVAVPVP
jgi:hypothetical protein